MNACVRMRGAVAGNARFFTPSEVKACVRVRRAPALAAVAVLAAACGASGDIAQQEPAATQQEPAATQQEPAATQQQPLAPELPASCDGPLPDLTRLGAAVQEQVRQRHGAVTQPDAPADAYGALGMILMAASLHEVAQPCLEQAVRRAPDDGRWPYYLGQLHRELGNLPEAVEQLDAARRLLAGADTVAPLVWLGNVHLEQGDAAAAAPLFEEALERDPDALSARFGLGRAALQSQDYERAAELLEEVLRRDPAARAAHYPLGRAYRALGDTARAEMHLAQRGGGPLEPADPLMDELDNQIESARGYERRGNEALDREDWTAAADYFRRGLEIDPDNPSLRHRLGTTLYVTGDPAGAAEQFERIIRNDPTFPAAHYSFGILLQTGGRHREAIAAFEETLRLQPTDADARLRLAVSLRGVGEPRRALDAYRQILRVDAVNIDAHFGEAMTLVQMNRYREARDRLIEDTEAFPPIPVFAHALARVLAAAPDETVRDGPRALDIANALAEQLPPSLDLGETLAMALAASGRYQEAATLQRDLVQAAESGGFPAPYLAHLRTMLQRYAASPAR